MGQHAADPPTVIKAKALPTSQAPAAAADLEPTAEKMQSRTWNPLELLGSLGCLFATN